MKDSVKIELIKLLKGIEICKQELAMQDDFTPSQVFSHIANQSLKVKRNAINNYEEQLITALDLQMGLSKLG